MPINPLSAIRDNKDRGKVGDFLREKIHVASKLSIAYCPHCQVITNQSAVVTPCLNSESDGKRSLSF